MLLLLVNYFTYFHKKNYSLNIVSVCVTFVRHNLKVSHKQTYYQLIIISFVMCRYIYLLDIFPVFVPTNIELHFVYNCNVKKYWTFKNQIDYCRILSPRTILPGPPSFVHSLSLGNQSADLIYRSAAIRLSYTVSVLNCFSSIPAGMVLWGIIYKGYAPIK